MRKNLFKVFLGIAFFIIPVLFLLNCTETVNADSGGVATCDSGDGCRIGCAPADPDCGVRFQNPLNFSSFGELADNIIHFIFMVGVALAPLMYIVAGFYFVTAAGDPKKVTTAKNIILYTTIGLGIILFARGLIYVVQQVIGG